VKAYLLKRLVGLIPIIFGISVLVFIIMRMLPGDVAAMIVAGSDDQAADPEAVAIVREQLGLDRPLLAQYVSWVGGLLRLDAGTSLWSGQSVFQEILQRLPLTLELAFLGLLVSLIIAIPAGVLSAAYQDTWVDHLLRGFSVAGLGIPSFWLGTMVLLFLTVWFNWVPPLGYVGFTTDPLRNLSQLMWPAIVLGIADAAVVSRLTRSAMLEVLREDYVRTARAKGVGGPRLLVHHALRNALLPVLTMAAIQFGQLLSGAVVVETIFTLPGLGRFLVDSIFHRDYPVVQTMIVMIGLLFVLLNLAVDIVYGFLNPRVRYG
jgi:peptide/nickel transport system permease protein